MEITLYIYNFFEETREKCIVDMKLIVLGVTMSNKRMTRVLDLVNALKGSL